MVWQRPADVPFPNVWHRFQAKGPDSDQLVWYTVQDLPVEQFQDAILHLKRHFARDEQMNKALGLENDSVGMEEAVQLWNVMLPEKLSLVCFREGSDEIIGVNVLAVASKSDKDELKVRSQSTQDIIDIHAYVMTERCNVFEHHRVDQYLNAGGLAVNRRYRRIGIATEMLRARGPICRELGYPVTVTNFTTHGSQRAAEKAGFRTDVEVTYDELATIRPNFAYPGIREKSIKKMSLVVD